MKYQAIWLKQMLTDIFARRYSDIEIWDSFGEPERRLLVQSFRIVSEQLFPYFDGNGKVKPGMKGLWDDLNKTLAMELGLKDLSSPTYGYYKTFGDTQYTKGGRRWVSGEWAKVTVCENFICAEYDQKVPADRFIKERLSLIEIAFRRKSNVIKLQKQNLEQQVADARSKVMQRPGFLRSIPELRQSQIAKVEKGIRSNFSAEEALFEDSWNELNTRFQHAGTVLDYHNGFIQVSSDEVTNAQIHRPFCAL